MATIRVQREDLDKEQDALIPECRALVEVLSAKQEEANGNDVLLLRYQVLAAGKAEAVGMRYTERFTLSRPAMPRLTCLLKRLGLAERGEPADEVAEFDDQDLVGLQFVVDVVHEDVERKKGGTYTVCKWPWGATWDAGHKDVAEFMRSVTGRSRPGAPRPPQGGTGAARPPQQQAPAANGAHAQAAVPVDDEV